MPKGREPPRPCDVEPPVLGLSDPRVRGSHVLDRLRQRYQAASGDARLVPLLPVLPWVPALPKAV